MGKVSKNTEVLGGITPVAFLDRLIENIQTRSKDKKIDIPTYVQTPAWQWWKETPRVITSDNKLRMIQDGLANVIKLKGFEKVWYNFLNWVKIDLETQQQKQASHFSLINEEPLLPTVALKKISRFHLMKGFNHIIFFWNNGGFLL